MEFLVLNIIISSSIEFEERLLLQYMINKGY